jgi:type II secretory pathway component GspD/PulD (secretin)
MVSFFEPRASQKAFVNFSAAALIGLGAAVLTGISGCATALSVEEEAPSRAQPTTAPPTQAPAPRMAQPPAPAQPEKLPRPTIKEMTLEEQPFRVTELAVLEERGQTVLKVKFSAPVTQYRHFSLTQPSRIVLDIFGDAKRQARVETFRAETHWLSTLRLSSGEGYLRVVLEIAAGSVPAYMIEPEDGGLKAIIGPANPQLTAKKELQLVKGGKRVDVSVAEAKPTAPAAEAKAAEAKQEPAAKGAAEEEKKYTGQRISLDFKDADIKNVFRLLAEVSGDNIIVTDDVVRKVTIRLVDVPWDQALDLLMRTNGLDKEKVGNVVRISTEARLKTESDQRASRKKAKEGEEDLQTTYLSVNYAKVKDLVDKVKPVLSKRPEASIVADERSNTLIVRDIKKGIEDANAIVSRLDIRTAQVQIESNLIETTPTFARSLGMEFNFDRSALIRSSFPAGSPAGSTPFFSVLQDKLGALQNLQFRLSAAEKDGNIRIISRPSVVTLNNVASTIQSLRILRITLPSGTSSTAVGTGASAGTTVATERVNVGITLTVTPQVSADGFILMNITVKSSSIAESATVSGSSAVLPFDELSREAIANVLVRDGETVVIGGIMKDTASTSESGIPFLKDIPLFGWLFKNARWQKDFEELMVFITPRIVSGGSENLPTAEQLWRQQYKATEGG